jgi:tetratricopeptide (TPR) repeat protein
LRADFYGRALRHRPLADAMQNHVENLGPMNREELQEAIVRPAKDVGVTFEPGLVDTLLDTVQSQAGGLPLLQFALREMWARQVRKTLTRKSYDEIGGVGGALAQRAETVFAGLTQNGADSSMDKAFQRLFTRLVTLGEGQEDTRRVVERGELGDSDWVLAQRLADEQNRLVVTNASSARETAEVVHEALIRHWPKLVDWVNRDRAFHLWLRQIRSNIELWSAHPDDDGTLLRGGMLAQATDWLAKRRDDLSSTELAYIEASIELRRKAEAEKEAAYQAELKRQQDARDQARRRQRQAAVAAVFFGALAIAAAVAGVFAIKERNQARTNFALAREAADSLVTNIAGLRNESGMSAKSVQKVLENAKGTIEHLAAGAPNDRELQASRARMLNEFSMTYRALGRVDEAVKALRDGLAIRQRLAAAEPDNPDLQRAVSESYNSLGVMGQDQNNFDDALKFYRESLTIRTRLAAAAPDDPAAQRAMARIYNNIGDSLMKQGKLDEALDALAHGRAIDERLIAADANNETAQRGVSFIYGNIGYVTMMQGKLDEALTFYRDSLAIRQRLHTAKPNDQGREREVSVTQDEIGDVLVRQGKLDDALAVFRDSRAIRARLAVADTTNISSQRDLAVSDAKIADVLARKGKLDEAVELLHKSLALCQRLATADGGNRQWRKDLQDRLGEAAGLAWRLVLARDFAKALDVEDQAIALAPDTVWLYENRAYALMFLDHADEARALYLQYRGREARSGKTWDADILTGFADMRQKGLAHPLMDEITVQFAAGSGSVEATRLPVANR